MTDELEEVRDVGRMLGQAWRELSGAVYDFYYYGYPSGKLGMKNACGLLEASIEKLRYIKTKPVGLPIMIIEKAKWEVQGLAWDMTEYPRLYGRTQRDRALDLIETAIERLKEKNK